VDSDPVRLQVFIHDTKIGSVILDDHSSATSSSTFASGWIFASMRLDSHGILVSVCKPVTRPVSISAVTVKYTRKIGDRQQETEAQKMQKKTARDALGTFDVPVEQSLAIT
jgi:hypothetical protein